MENKQKIILFIMIGVVSGFMINTEILLQKIYRNQNSIDIDTYDQRLKEKTTVNLFNGIENCLGDGSAMLTQSRVNNDKFMNIKCNDDTISQNFLLIHNNYYSTTTLLNSLKK